jgi:hypothetical protein
VSPEAWAVGVSCGALLAGYALGWRQGAQRTQERLSDLIERIEPNPRTPGQPTNTDAPPSRVTEPKRRPGHFMS